MPVAFECGRRRFVANKLHPKGGSRGCPGVRTEEMQKPASGSEESHMDRAMLGPTPDNPSLSLKNRLKRASFFDQREREVAAGTAEPVDPEAGLPEAGVEEGFELEPGGESEAEDRPAR